MKKAVISGALGFIGFALCTRLLDEGYEVFGVDSFLHENDRKILENKQLEIGRNANFHFKEADASTIDFKGFAGKVDIFIDCTVDRNALLDSIEQKIKDGQERIKNEVDYCQEVGASYFQISTIEVFDLKTEDYINEETKINPKTAIGQIKAEEEKFLISRKELLSCIVRLPTVYGPYQPKEMTFQQIIDGKKHVKMDVITEDLIYIEDVIDGLIALIKYKKINGMIHLVSGEGGLWLKAYKQLKNNRQIEVDVNSNVILSSKKAKQCIGFKPKVSIQAGLAEQINTTKQVKRLQKLGLID